MIARMVTNEGYRTVFVALALLLGCGSDADKARDAGDDAHEPSEPSDAGEVAQDAASSGAHDAGGMSMRDAGSMSMGSAEGGVNGGKSPYFDQGAFFLDDVYDAQKSPQSDKAIAALRSRGGFGNGGVFQIDFSIDVLSATGSTPKREFITRTEDNGLDEEFYSPDCDHVPVPVPEGGNLEGEDGYTCSSDGDCHLIVWSEPEQKLYEMWRADISGTRFVGGCLAVWDTSRALGPAGRGLQCSSADAAGFPIAPLLFTADEVAAGAIEHAIRFIVPNDRTRRGFVPPATHGTGTTRPADAPYYGFHLRLRRDYPLDRLPNEGARVVARALQRYGMYHADGGNIALTAQSDRHTQKKWQGTLAPRDLSALKIDDFELIDHGAFIPLTYDCKR
jgi:hypothetical protein